MKIGFLGLGAMGMPMARRLLSAGHDVTSWNRSHKPMSEFSEAGGKTAPSPTKAVRDAEVVISVLANDMATEQVLLQPGNAISGFRPGAIHLSCATISIDLTKKLASIHSREGHAFVAAPLFGLPAAIAAGKLYLVMAGDPAAQKRLEPISSALAQRTISLGTDPCLAVVAKLANNFLILGVIQALGEAFALVEKHGLSAPDMADIIQSMDFGGRIFKAYSQSISTNTYEPPGFQLVLGLKDIDLILQAGKSSHVPMRTASLIRDQFLSALARGYGQLDWSAIAAVTLEDSALMPGGLLTAEK